MISRIREKAETRIDIASWICNSKIPASRQALNLDEFVSLVRAEKNVAPSVVQKEKNAKGRKK